MRVGGNVEELKFDSGAPTDWFSVMVSWSLSGDSVLYFMDTVQVGSDAGLVAAVGSGLSATETVIGASITTPAAVWDGFIGPVILWDTPATPAIIALGAVT